MKSKYQQHLIDMRKNNVNEGYIQCHLNQLTEFGTSKIHKFICNKCYTSVRPKKIRKK